MPLKFTKMHALGNDFMVIDGIHQRVDLSSNAIRALSGRHTGIGFDQCLVIEAPNTAEVDFFYRIFNANGEAVGQCGNGARCIARFIEHYQLADSNPIRIATQTTQLSLQLNPDHTVTVNMGIPSLAPEEYYDIPLSADATYRVHALSIGNPHAVLLTDHLLSAPVASVGKIISEHALFPEQTNVGFCEIVNPHHIKLRVYERGCGETNACGSGAVAAVAAGRVFHQLASTVRVSLPGGDLTVDWPDMHGPIFLTGPASFVYEGQLFK